MYKIFFQAFDTAQGYAGEAVAKLAAEFKETPEFKARHQKSKELKALVKGGGLRVAGGRPGA